MLDEITEQAWTNNDTITVSGAATDVGGSALNYIVWSKDNQLSTDDVLATTENKVVIVDGQYSFVSVAGEQNATYYVYAVDYAGNVSSAKTVKVKIDKTAPKITGFTFSTQENSIVADLINFASFGSICKEKMYLTVSAADEKISSGYKTIALCPGASSTPSSRPG